MGAAWSKATDKRVTLRVFPPSFPSESSIIDRMAIDGLQAATMSVVGLGELDPAFNVFGIPFFFESDAELEYVQKRLTPYLSQKLGAKKYHLINWGNGGWVRLFSKKPIRTFAELQAASLYTSEGDPKVVTWYAQNGIHAVQLATGEIPKQLKLPAGVINAAPSPPVFALMLQFFKDAPNMLDERFGPLVAATVMTDRAWQQISPEDRVKLLAVAADTEKQIGAEAPGIDNNAIEEMKKAGLKVISLDAREKAVFLAAAEKAANSQRGVLVPAEAFDLAMRERDAYRKSKKAPAPVQVKLGTLAPEHSPWTDALKRMGEAWAKTTDKRVTLQLQTPPFPGASSLIAGMAGEGLQAATLTAAGLREIDPAFNVFGIPFFFESDAELAHVQKALAPLLSQKLEAKKYHLINWAHGGWARVFSKKPIRTYADLQAAKLATAAGDPGMAQWHAQNGFHAVPLAAGEIPRQLKLAAGTINAAPSPPVFAAMLQLFCDAPNMLDLKVGPLAAATVMTDRAWQQISPDDRVKLMTAAADTEKQISAAAPGIDRFAIEEMKKGGLVVITLAAREEAAFRASAEKAASSQRGAIVSAEVFDAAVRERDAYRKSKTK
jgi:TRAP-type C4-dicarboxylate transport system substrate-binding protein